MRSLRRRIPNKIRGSNLGRGQKNDDHTQRYWCHLRPVASLLVKREVTLTSTQLVTARSRFVVEFLTFGKRKLADDAVLFAATVNRKPIFCISPWTMHNASHFLLTLESGCGTFSNPSMAGKADLLRSCWACLGAHPCWLLAVETRDNFRQDSD